ncbi:hypothetical protein TNCV_3904481 [Trichonephila clavipes]|nr:hypothetical protein TNCV_3904481 [Trichonephila clavipes]
MKIVIVYWVANNESLRSIGVYYSSTTAQFDDRDIFHDIRPVDQRAMNLDHVPRKVHRTEVVPVQLPSSVVRGSKL